MSFLYYLMNDYSNLWYVSSFTGLFDDIVESYVY